MSFKTSLLLISLINHLQSSYGQTPPNIIFILADDLGFNDIGYQNPEIISPNLDNLAKNGVILEKNYVQPVCTPSRASLMSGMYPFKIGRQGILPLLDRQPTGLTLDYNILPQYLKELGYATHIVGKWHLGFCKEDYLPTNRGFDSFYGYVAAGEDYYDKTQAAVPYLYDFFLNDEILPGMTNYSTDLYLDRTKQITQEHNKENPLFLYLALQNVHTPLQVPQRYEDMFPNEKDPDRRSYLGMVTAMDDMVGAVIEDLKAKGLYENSIIIFSSDNGGATGNGGASNYPLKSQKGTLWEGGIRVPGFIHSPNHVVNPGRVYGELLHITDWLPTILSAINSKSTLDDAVLDGVDQYAALFQDISGISPRDAIVHEISEDPGIRNLYRGSIRTKDGWKYLRNPNPNTVLDISYLYNIDRDPIEKYDMKYDHPEIYYDLRARFDEYVAMMVEADNPGGNPFDNISDGNGNLGVNWCNEDNIY